MSKGLEVAIKAAKEAGEILREHFHRPNHITIKEDNSFQTEADRLSEEKIISIIKENFPNHSINAEESGFSKEDSKYLWLVDPLDGTTNYATYVPFFSVSIALIMDKKIQCGVVYDPVHDELFFANVGRGAYLNDRLIKVSKKRELKELIVSYSRPSSVKDKFIKIFPDMETKTRAPKILGSTALQLCYVAVGRLDADISFAQHPWDIAAGVLIVQEAGGYATDLLGRDWSIDTRDIVVSNGKIHKELLEILKA